MSTVTTNHAPPRDFDLVLVLGGGNALGAFQAGVYQALHEQDLHPDWIVGTSIGAINGALIAGSPPAERLDTLRTFWRPDRFGLGEPGTPWLPTIADIARRSMAALWTVAAGRRGIFGPMLSSRWTDDRRSIFETHDLVARLCELVDFDRLNDGACRYTATAVDLATGDDVAFDTRTQRIDARHVRASAALPVAFPPVEIDGRWLVDGGVSANLALDPVLGQTPGQRPARPVLCLAVDLLPLGQPLPTTLGETASRLQDLIFAAQTRRTIERWRAVRSGDTDIRQTLVRIAYTDQADEVAGKALDFSGPTIAARWASGYRATMAIVDRIATGALPVDTPGLTILDPDPTSVGDPTDRR